MQDKICYYRPGITCSPQNKQPYTYKLRVPISRIWQSAERVSKEIKRKPKNKPETSQHNKQPYIPKTRSADLRFQVFSGCLLSVRGSKCPPPPAASAGHLLSIGRHLLGLCSGRQVRACSAISLSLCDVPRSVHARWPATSSNAFPRSCVLSPPRCSPPPEPPEQIVHCSYYSKSRL